MLLHYYIILCYQKFLIKSFTGWSDYMEMTTIHATEEYHCYCYLLLRITINHNVILDRVNKKSNLRKVMLVLGLNMEYLIHRSC